MKAKSVYLLTLGILLTLALGACSMGAPISEAATQPPVEESISEPDDVVNGFYDWYLAYKGNVLAKRAYQTRAELTGDFISSVNDLLDSFDKGSYDPFLCAQDIPQFMEIETLTIDGEMAQATLVSSFDHHVLITLRDGGSGWQIDEITCQVANQADVRPAPSVAINEFYRWYLNYQGNVLVDGAYRDRPELSTTLIAEVDEMMADPQMGMGDPFLCAQDKPGDFELQMVEGSENSAVVEVATDFENHRFRVTVIWNGNFWQINDVACEGGEPTPDAETPADEPQVGGNRFADETFGYALALPGGWTFEDVNLNEPGRPPAGNMERIVHLMPEGWDEQYVPLTLEIYALNATDLEREIMPADAQETMEINGLTVVKNLYRFGEREMVKYDVQAPNTADLHVVLTDFLTGWPERLEGNENIAEQIAEILKSITFTQ